METGTSKLMPRGPHALILDAAWRGDAYLIWLQGELDLSGCVSLELALGKAERSRAGKIVIDVEQLTFIDASGLNVLHQAGRRSSSNGNRLGITRGKGDVADMFHLTHLDETLPLIAPRTVATVPV